MPSRAEQATIEALRTLRESDLGREDKRLYESVLRQIAAAPKILESLGPCLDVAPQLTNLAHSVFRQGVEGKGPTLEELSRLSEAAIENQTCIQRLARLLIEASR